MLSSYLTIMPYSAKNPQGINFTGGIRPFKNPIKPARNIAVAALQGIETSLVDFINKDAYKRGLSNNDLLKTVFKYLPHIPKVGAVASKSAIVGNVRVTTLIDGEQIFPKKLELLDYAEDFILDEMFEFQNLSVDGHRWITNGAEKVAGSKEQQQMLWKILKKKQARPDMPIQVILDAHKWYIDGHGKKVRHYGNQDMIRFLKQKRIDVVPYPRAAQGGSALQHIKLLIVGGKKGKKAMITGMNDGSHSAANHDFGILLEELPGKKNSEIDNLMDHHFNPDWALAWKKIGETKLVNGPISKEEQKRYFGINKEIKEENVEYVRLVGEFFDTKEARSRYREGKLGLIPANPLTKPAIKIMGTKPRELEEVGKAGDESTRAYLLPKLRTCKKVRGELFVSPTDRETVDTIIERHKSGKLDAAFLISSDILKYPYCRMAYHRLLEAGVPLRVYKADKATRQRLHAKLFIFDDKEIMTGSTNPSGMGLNSNLGKGLRDDCELNSERIEAKIQEYADDVRDFEKELGIPSLKDITNYEKLLKRRKKFKKAINHLEKKGEAEIKLDNKVYTFATQDSSTLNTINGYYGLMKKLHNSKEKYKRGNNELSVAFESPSLAKVFGQQFDRDWKYSESDFDKLKKQIWGIKKPANDNPVAPKKKLDKVG